MNQKTITLVSPFPDVPGTVVIPAQLDAQQFHAWWVRANEVDNDEDDERHPAFKAWDCRFHFILKQDLQLPKGYQVEQSGLKLPDPRITRWFENETNFLVRDIFDAKNWQGPSENT